MIKSYHPSKSRARVRHRVKELLFALPVDTAEAKRVLRENTGIDQQKLRRLLNDPFYLITAEELILLANFFCVSVNDIVHSERNVNEIVAEIMERSQPIRSLVLDESL